MSREEPTYQYLGSAVIVVLSFVLLVPLLQDWLEVGAPVTDLRVTRLLLPVLYFGALLGYVGWQLNRENGGNDMLRIAGWSVAMSALLSIAVFFSLVNYVSGYAEIVHILNRAALRGAVVGLVIGHYSASNRRTRNQLERYSEQLTFVNRLLRHDIRNDVMVISGFAGMLSDQHWDERFGKDESIDTTPIKRIEERADHIAELADIASRLGTEAEYQEQPVQLNETLEKTVERIRTEYPDATVDLETDADDITVAADNALKSVFENLLRNAVQHNDQPTPEISVRTEAGPETVDVRVADNGPGLPETTRASLFDPGTKGTESAGSGLGLYLVETLVERYDGDISVEPNEPSGTVFVTELERRTETAETERQRVQ